MTKDTWRLIYQEAAADCYYNMGLDQAILESIAQGKAKNTIRFYRWNPSAVSIGYFQSMKKVVHIENCKKFGVNFIRRITGGGAVYHDYDGEITYSINCSESYPLLPQEIIKIYELFCKGIIFGLKELGVTAEFRPINDIVLTANGKKISGNALTKRNGVILQHGTILRKVDPEKMFSVLIIPDEKFKAQLISSAKERVSSLEQELIQPPSFEKLRNALICGFESALNISLNKENLLKEEISEAKRIAKIQFKSKDWSFKR